jgi:nucleoid-associated protein YgaU
MANEVITTPQDQPTNLAEQLRPYQPQSVTPQYQQTQTIEPARIPDAQPPIRTQTRQPRRVEDMSEEQAVASGNTRITPPMASALEPQAANTRTGVYHTVASGDNLYVIAKRYYGNGDEWTLIRDANRNVVQPNGTIMLGSRLLIPSKKQVAVQQNNPAIQSANSAPREIVVKSGQTLSELAKQYLGNAGDWDELLKANRDQLSRPEQLRAGMTLKLPAKAVSQATTQQPQPTTTTPRQPAVITQDAKTYTIQSGDTLSSIAAQKLGSAGKWYKLYQHNKSTISDPDNLTVGTTIKIPG